MKRLTTILLFTVSCFFLLPSEYATASMYYVLEGTITSESDTAGQFSVGDRMYATFSFDDSVPRSGGGINSSIFENAFLGITIDFPDSGYGISATSSLARTVNTLTSDSLGLELRSSALTTGLVAPIVNGGTLDFGTFKFYDSSDSTFSSNPPPIASPSNPLWTNREFWFDWDVPGGHSAPEPGIRGTIDTVVPVPGALILAASGLLTSTLGLKRLRRKH